MLTSRPVLSAPGCQEWEHSIGATQWFARTVHLCRMFRLGEPPVCPATMFFDTLLKQHLEPQNFSNQ